jgi:hypothetical protein
MACHHRLNLVRLPVFAICLALCRATTASAQLVSDDSIARIRARLEEPPPKIDLAVPTATFSVYIEGHRPLESVFEQPPWVPVPDEFAAPKISGGGLSDPALGRQPMPIIGGSVDYIAASRAISRAIRTRAARAEMKRAIAEYCGAHREEPGADLICRDPQAR